MTVGRNEVFDRVLSNRTRYITVVLEDIYQAHNASAVIRSCDCFGIQDLHIIEKRNHYRVSSDVAMGADKWLSMYRHQSPENPTSDVYEKLRSEGYRIVATTPNRDDVELDNFDLAPGKVALVFGTELNGLSEEAMSGADEFLKIPVYGFTESFNISVSAAIIMHNLVAKLHKSKINWRLTGEEEKELKLQWLRKSVKSHALLEKEFYKMKGPNI